MKIRRPLQFLAASSILAACLWSSGCSGSRRGARPGEIPPAEASGERMNRVYELLSAGRHDEAAGVLSDILRLDPENRQARLELAYLHIRFKRWKDAIALLDSLLDETPTDMRLRMERGYARQAIGELAAAADEFSIVEREPNQFQEQARAALKVIASESSPTSHDVASTTLINEGYDELRRGDAAAAREKFEKALLADPSKTEVSKQLGYMSAADGDLATAAKEFAGAHLIAPRDFQTSLELGYLYDSLHDEAAALSSFTAALPSPDRRIHAAAAAALKNIYGRGDPLYLDVYAAPSYTSRFKDEIAYLEAVVGYKPDWSGPLSFYFAGRYTQDSRSHSGLAPDIYSDNVVSYAPGIRVQPKGLNASLSAEWGGATNLLKSSEHPDAIETGGRVVLADYHYWEGPRRTFADAGGSLGYYSRYRGNVIGYLQLRGGIKVWDDHSSQLSVYAPANVVKDGNRDFFNNIAEIGAGAELQPSTKVSLKLRGEYLHGVYMGIEGRDRNPYGLRYNDFRVMIIYSGHFTKQRKAEKFPARPKRAYLW